jgi:hypothetical protein
MQLYSMPSQHFPSRQTRKPSGHIDVSLCVHVGTVEQGTPGGVLSSGHCPPAPPVPTVVEVVPVPLDREPPLPPELLAPDDPPDDPELPPAPLEPWRPPHEAMKTSKQERDSEFLSHTNMGRPRFRRDVLFCSGRKRGNRFPQMHRSSETS